MKRVLKTLREFLEIRGLSFVRTETMQRLVLGQYELIRQNNFLDFLDFLSPEAMRIALRIFRQSHGENFQDIFAMLILGLDRNGFFVEFGATDGISGSNSYMLEKKFGWKGILAEPARGWARALQENRHVEISHKCVWRDSGEKLAFREVEDGGFSTLDAFRMADRHAARREKGQIYDVETITLNDLLTNYNAPSQIDFLSIDTEGSEFEILSNFNFVDWQVSILAVEHNFRPDREDIRALMRSHGYVRAPVKVSKFDDWYVAGSLESAMRTIFRPDLKDDN